MQLQGVWHLLLVQILAEGVFELELFLEQNLLVLLYFILKLHCRVLLSIRVEVKLPGALVAHVGLR